MFGHCQTTVFILLDVPNRHHIYTSLLIIFTINALLKWQKYILKLLKISLLTELTIIFVGSRALFLFASRVLCTQHHLVWRPVFNSSPISSSSCDSPSPSLGTSQLMTSSACMQMLWIGRCYNWRYWHLFGGKVFYSNREQDLPMKQAWLILWLTLHPHPTMISDKEYLSTFATEIGESIFWIGATT